MHGTLTIGVILINIGDDHHRAMSTRVEIKESEAKLCHRLGRTHIPSSKERLQILLWIKTKSIRTRQHLCQHLGRNKSSTIYRWL
jgi:hypothetical protein